MKKRIALLTALCMAVCLLAGCDIFLSAGQKQMNQLDTNAKPEANPDGLDFVLEGTRFNILENKVALAVPEGNPAGVESYDDLAAAGAAAYGGWVSPAAPFGAEATHRLLVFADLWPEADHDLVVGHLCHHGGHLSPDVPHRLGCL